jgi:hypothetical protein
MLWYWCWQLERALLVPMFLHAFCGVQLLPLVYEQVTDGAVMMVPENLLACS